MITIISVFIIALLAGMESVLDAWEFHQPVLAATLVGVAFGHPVEGLLLGGSLQLITLGWMNVGAAMAPDTALAAIASSILVTGPTQLPISQGIALAIPIAVAGQILTIFVRTITVSFAHISDSLAEDGRDRMIEALHFVGLGLQGLRVAIPAMLIMALPAHTLTDALNSIPQVITGGLQVAGGFIVVVGYAMVVNLMAEKRLWPIFFLGFALAAVTSLNLLAMGIIGTSIALIMLQLKPKQIATKNDVDEKLNPVFEKSITRRDQINTFIRQGFLLGSFNYERMQNMGVLYIMLPTLRRLYGDNKKEFSNAMKRHLEFFNTHPYMASPIIGVSMALEEQKANGLPGDGSTISSVKVGMMGPVAGVGDPLYWGTLRPILGALAASFAAQGSMLGPVIFFVGWNVIRLTTLWFGQKIGYSQGTNIGNNLAGGLLQRVTETASTLGMFMMGVLIPRWTTMNFPLVISKVKTQDSSKIDTNSLMESTNSHSVTGQQLVDFVSQLKSGLTLNDFKLTTLGDIFNQLIPGLIPLLSMFGVMYLLKKNVSPIVIIFGIFVLGILGYWVGIFGV